MLSECGRVKIADLGVCNEFLDEDAFVLNGSTAGTPAFRAPETLITGQVITNFFYFFHLLFYILINKFYLFVCFFFFNNIVQHMYSGKAADIWALGATVYSIVFGNVPFIANNIPAVYEKIKNDRLHFPSTIKISDDLKELIIGMLEKDPSQRLTLPQIKVNFILFMIIFFSISFERNRQ